MTSLCYCHPKPKQFSELLLCRSPKLRRSRSRSFSPRRRGRSRSFSPRSRRSRSPKRYSRSPRPRRSRSRDRSKRSRWAIKETWNPMLGRTYSPWLIQMPHMNCHYSDFGQNFFEKVKYIVRKNKLIWPVTGVRGRKVI